MKVETIKESQLSEIQPGPHYSMDKWTAAQSSLILGVVLRKRQFKMKFCTYKL